ncbi:DUF4445 domain-containing protein [bacterium]|nr:DUF4445 domain-containing protein [bacterium]
MTATLTLDGKGLPIAEGKTIFDHADILGVKIPTSCGRVGSCHECIVEVKAGAAALSPPTAEERFLRGGYRLACQCRLLHADEPVVLHTLRRGRPQICTHGEHVEVPLDPMVRRSGGNIVYGDEVLCADDGQPVYGLAVDVGTTTVAMNLVDLETGDIAATYSMENPQAFGGSDVIHRIRYDRDNQGELHKIIIAYLNNALRELPCDRRRIFEVVVAGNATMRDLFFNLPVQSIGVRPYMSMVEKEYREKKRASTSLSAVSKQLKLRINPKGRIYGLPLIGCHVGADTAACLLVANLHTRDEIGMMLDIGTNTEVVLGNRRRILCASCPAGPAFEGGGITCGMPGLEGAIETIRLDNGRAHYQVIGGVEPEGICGSGIIDLLAELLASGRMDVLGRLAGDAQDFLVVPERDIRILANDISELAQAKAANYTGQRILLNRYGISPEQLSVYYLAGGFANYINVANAMKIGLIPTLPLQRVRKLGNASLSGATQALVSRARRAELEQLVTRIEHVELETIPEFFEIFVEGCMYQAG